eukprot:4043955-Pleurochrysis_carterae.AAC.1
MYGWTMLFKWGHPVATFPVMNRSIRHIRKMMVILRIITSSPGTNPICRVPISATSRTNSAPTALYSNERAAGFRARPPDHTPKSILRM